MMNALFPMEAKQNLMQALFCLYASLISWHSTFIWPTTHDETLHRWHPPPR
ncbi:MAG: hypothetical protein LC114_00120 [Bryobacterales bacterium]|nr:hypothetical protein [Bryobacterales bacterium]